MTEFPTPDLNPNEKPEENALGTSTDALVNVGLTDQSKNEKAIEALSSMYKALLDGDQNNIAPIVLCVQNGKIIAEKCDVDSEGNISLPAIKVQSKTDLKKKRSMVTRIMRKVVPVLKAEIENVTFYSIDAQRHQ